MFNKDYFNNQIGNTELSFRKIIEKIKKIYPDVLYSIGNSWKYVTREEMLPLTIYLTITPKSLINTSMQKEWIVLGLEIFDSTYEDSFKNTAIMEHSFDKLNRICFHYGFSFSDGEPVIDPIYFCCDFKEEGILIGEISERCEKYNHINFNVLINALIELENANNSMNKD